MISIFNNSEEIRNNAMPSNTSNEVEKGSIISCSLIEMRNLVKNSLSGINTIEWEVEELK